jgi:cation diffusion facilitator family transporter
MAADVNSTSAGQSMFRRCVFLSKIGGDVMSNLLIRMFIKDYQDISSAKARERYGKLAGLMGIFSNLILFLIKIVIGTLTGSISITADAVNNLTDSGSSIVTLLGFKISGRPADAKHPYGHGRMEYISGLIVSFIILLLGVQLILGAADKIFHPQQPEFSLIAVGILIVSIFLKLWQCLFYRKIGKSIDSLTLLTTAADSRNDIFATTTVLLGLIITRLTGVNLDGYMGIAVALFIIVSGIKLVSETVSPLLGLAPKRELVEYIQQKVLSYENVIGIHDLTVHSYGAAECFASLHCEVPAELDIMLGHDIINNIENDFYKDLGIHMVIHLDPVVTGDEKTNALKAQVQGVIEAISPLVSIHDFRVVWGISRTNLIFDLVIPYDCPLDDSGLVRQICERIIGINPAYNAVITVDHHHL